MESEFCKLEIFLPESHLEAVQQALWSVDAGHIGRYDCCLSYSPVIGAWRPLAGTAPYLGRMPCARAQGGGYLPDRPRGGDRGGRQAGPPL